MAPRPSERSAKGKVRIKYKKTIQNNTLDGVGVHSIRLFFLNLMPLVSNILGSSLGQKYLMALSGVGLFGFIVVHMLGNLTILAGPSAINEYAAKLHSMGPLLWIARIGLLGMAGVHIWAAVRLTRDNRKARSVQYEGVVDPVDRHRKSKIVSNYASRTMIYSGLIIAAFALFHIAHFTWKIPQINGVEVDFETFYVYEVSAGSDQVAYLTPLPDGVGKEGENAVDVYKMLTTGFKVWWVSIFYVIAVGLLCIHLSHGLSAMFQSLGLKTKAYEKWIDNFACATGWLLFGGYASVPVSILLGFIP